MKSCESRIAREKWNLQCALGIVEVIATSGDGRNALQALEACRDEISFEFLDRLVKRPETIVLLQCSCKLGCDGGCDCSMYPRKGMDMSIWKKFDKDSAESIWKQDDNPPSSSEGKKCSCDGLPRVASDLMMCIKQDGLLTWRKKFKVLSNLLSPSNWLDLVCVEPHSHELTRLLRGSLSKSQPWVDVLNSLHGLRRARILKAADEAELQLFCRLLANHLILNLATSRSLGYLNAYIPQAPEEVESYLRSSNPVKRLLANLRALRDDIVNDPKGKKISAFCIDLANQTYEGKGVIDSVGYAMLSAALFGGCAPRRSCTGELYIQCLIVKGKDLIKCIEDRGLNRLLAEYDFDPRYSYKVCYGRIFSNWDSLIVKSDISDLKDVQRSESEERAGYEKKGVVEMAESESEEDSDLEAWLNKPLPRGREGEPMTSDEIFSFLDAMEDIYISRIPSSESLSNIIGFHPVMQDELRRMQKFSRSNGDQKKRRLLNQVRRYFNRLPQAADDSSEVTRAFVSSHIVSEEEDFEDCRNRSWGRDDYHPLIPDLLKKRFQKDFEAVREGVRNRVYTEQRESLDNVNPSEQALKAIEKLEAEFERQIKDVEDQNHWQVSDHKRATRNCRKIQDELDDIDFDTFILLNKPKTRREPPLSLLSAETANHYRLSERGVEVVNIMLDTSEEGEEASGTQLGKKISKTFSSILGKHEVWYKRLKEPKCGKQD